MKKVYWTIGILIWLFGIPVIFGLYLNHQIQYEYSMGWRTTTDGDNIAIPIVGLFMINTIILLTCSGVYFVVKKIRNKISQRGMKTK